MSHERGGTPPRLISALADGETVNVEMLCLSVLYEGEATGYEINGRFKRGEEALFADASVGAIYPALHKLKQKGLVEIRVEQQDGKPDRKIYSITDAGRDAFGTMLNEPLANDRFESPFLYLMRFAHLLPRDVLSERIAARQKRLDAELNCIDLLLRKHGDDDRRWWLLEQRHAMTRALRDSLEAILRRYQAER